MRDEALADELHAQGASLAIFRLAPADYHRYHSPVSAVVGPTKKIEGDYYVSRVAPSEDAELTPAPQTVNPVAVNEDLDVFTENKRDVTILSIPRADSTPINVVHVSIGAMLVGSINSTVQQGQSVARGDEIGYFAYGGSTIVGVFPAGAVEWDQDLLTNSELPLETAVRVSCSGACSVLLGARG